LRDKSGNEEKRKITKIPSTADWQMIEAAARMIQTPYKILYFSLSPQYSFDMITIDTRELDWTGADIK